MLDVLMLGYIGGLNFLLKNKSIKKLIKIQARK